MTSVPLESKQPDDPLIGDPWFGAGLGAGTGLVGGGLLGATGGAVLGAGGGAIGGGLTGAALGSALGPAGALAGGLIGAGVGAINGGLVGGIAGGVGGGLFGAGVMGALGSQFISEGDFREFPDELEDQPLGPSGIQLCSRGAFGLSEAVGEAVNIEHWFLTSGGKEAGLTFDPRTADPLDTMMSPQLTPDGTKPGSQGDGVSCVPMEEMFPEHANVDVGCVEELMQADTNYGDYGLGGICKDAVESILDACDPDTTGRAIPESGFDALKRNATEMLFGPPSLEDAMPPPSLADVLPPVTPL